MYQTGHTALRWKGEVSPGSVLRFQGRAEPVFTFFLHMQQEIAAAVETYTGIWYDEESFPGEYIRGYRQI